MTHFLKSLIKVSEKAANIARICRQDKHLFKLLVQEKKEDEKNPKFVQDFKTLADVLIQETIKHDIGKQFPTVAPFIQGEESNTFSNRLGESISVVVQEDEASTAALLSQVLNGDTTAANLLAAEVHRSISVESDNVLVNRIPEDFELPMSHLGMWIDPIDSTAEYISGEDTEPAQVDIQHNGLQCVTVLIGIYDRRNGEPILGVVNQPFHTRRDAQWHGRCFWGISFENTRMCFMQQHIEGSRNSKIIVLSSSETGVLKKRLREAGYTLVEAAGAGYKCLAVALGSADAYVLSRGTTFRWDTCGPHALLQSQGGGIVSYSPTEEGATEQLNYLEQGVNHSPSIMIWCNKDGIIAYRNAQVLNELMLTLKKM